MTAASPLYVDVGELLEKVDVENSGLSGEIRAT